MPNGPPDRDGVRTHRLEPRRCFSPDCRARCGRSTLPRTADLAAQVYRTDLFARSGYVVWDSARFAGHQLLGYSLTFPALASVGGLRPLGPLAAAMSVVCVDDLVARLRPDIERLPGARFAAAAVGDLSAAASRSRSVSPWR